MKKSLLVGTSLIALLGASACQTTSTNISSAEQAPPGVTKEMYEHKVKQVKEQVEKIPDWFLEPPVEEGSIFAVGSGSTPDLQLSLDLAILQAKTTLADRFQSTLKSQTKNFVAKVGGSGADASVVNEVERATKNLIANTDVSGYHMVKNVIQSSGNVYRAFVLLEYSDAQANKILMNRIRKDRLLLNKLSKVSAFRDLDKEVNKVVADKKAKEDAALKALGSASSN